MSEEIVARRRPDGTWEVVPASTQPLPETHSQVGVPPEARPDPSEGQAPPPIAQRGY